MVVVYRDFFWERLNALDYAQPAMERLAYYKNDPSGCMQHLKGLRLVWPDWNPLSINTPGIWSLLKIRNVPHVYLHSPGCMDVHRVGYTLKRRLKWKTRTKWRLCGWEAVGRLGLGWTAALTPSETVRQHRVKMYSYLEKEYYKGHDPRTRHRKQKQRRDRQPMPWTKRLATMRAIGNEKKIFSIGSWIVTEDGLSLLIETINF